MNPNNSALEFKEPIPRQNPSSTRKTLGFRPSTFIATEAKPEKTSISSYLSDNPNLMPTSNISADQLPRISAEMSPRKFRRSTRLGAPWEDFPLRPSFFQNACKNESKQDSNSQTSSFPRTSSGVSFPKTQYPNFDYRSHHPSFSPQIHQRLINNPSNRVSSIGRLQQCPPDNNIPGAGKIPGEMKD